MMLVLLLAWILPLTAGSAAWLALNPARGPGWIATTLGYGIVFGLLLAAGATALFARADTAHVLLYAGPWLTVFAVAMGIVAWRRGRKLPRRSRPEHSQVQVEKWKLVPLAAAIMSLAWRGWIALREILLRPTFPWDAWDAWDAARPAAKPSVNTARETATAHDRGGRS